MTNDSPKLAKFLSIGGIILTLLFLLGTVAYRFYKNSNKISEKNNISETKISIPENVENAFVNDVSGVQPIGDQKKLSDNVSQSEHYAIREITFGGFEVDMSGEVKNTPLEILNAKGETTVSRNGKSTSLLFSWKTNKLATSEITYAKDDGPLKNTVKEQGPGLHHALILNLEPSTRYTYYIIAKDQWGNMATSEKFSVFTSIKDENILNIIAQQFKQIFSWMNIK